MRRMLKHGFVLSTLLIVPAFALAQSESFASPRGITISDMTAMEVRGDFQVGPTRFVLEMDPGEERTVEVQLTSREGEPRTYTLTVEDFSVTNDGTDSIQFYGNGSGPFSAKSWIQPAASGLALNHGQRAFIPIKVTVPMNAAVGDHYSVALFQRNSNTVEGGGFNLVARIGALLLITVRGDTIKDGSVQKFFATKRIFWSLPAQFTVQYENKGTVHLVPTGSIDIKNIFGITVDNIPIKDWYVLRNSIRRREIIWQPKFALGYYTATLHLNSPGQPAEHVQKVSVWMIPAIPVALALLAIFVVSFFVQAFFSHFEIRTKKDQKKGNDQK